MFKIRTLLVFGAGAAAAYFMDPVHGAVRRAAASEALTAKLGRPASDAIDVAARRAAKSGSIVGEVVERVVTGTRRSPTPSNGQ